MERVFPLVRSTPRPDPRKPKTIVLVDADNVSFAQTGDFLKALEQTVEVVDFQAFGDLDLAAKDWALATRTFPSAKIHGIYAGASLKNGADIALTIAAVELTLETKADMAVLLSSDSDFTPLVKFLQARNVKVIGVGNANLHPARKNLFDNFYPIHPKSATQPEPAKPAEKKPAAKKTTGKPVEKPVTKLEGPLPKTRMGKPMMGRVKQILNASSEGDGWMKLSPLFAQLRKTYPEFQSKTFGHKTPSAFLKFHGETFEMSKDNQQVRLRGKKESK